MTWHICFEDKASTEHILKFLQTTEVGNRTKEKDRKTRDEERDEMNGWHQLVDHPWAEGEGEDEDEDDEELMAWNGSGHVKDDVVREIGNAQGAEELQQFLGALGIP
jgi:hypothetical protein